jgi:hypothetical protein
MDDVKTPNIPEFYVNGMKVAISPFDVTVEFGVQDIPQAESTTTTAIEVQTTMRPTVRIRMSLQYAVILGKVIDKAMLEHQAKNGFLQLPSELLTKLGITR